MAAAAVSCAGSREELAPVALLDDSFFQTKTHSLALVHSLVTHTHTRIIYISIYTHASRHIEARAGTFWS